MTTATERVFILGGTGNIGVKVVNDLIANNVPVTLYARDPSKAKSTFTAKTDLIQIVQGDYKDLSPLKEGVKGHTRLFLLVADFSRFSETKREVAEYAYAAGVKQIVDISSFTVDHGWRRSFLGQHHYLGEKAVLDIPNRGKFVALRPGVFMSNFLWMSNVATQGFIYDDIPADQPQSWISPNDIGAVAATILQDDVDKHGDAVYGLHSDVVTPNEQAAIFSRILGREISYKQVTPVERYRLMVEHHVPSPIALDMVDNLVGSDKQRVSPCIEILTGKKPETLEHYLTENKHLIK
ncbi:Prestalk A differentiation protein A [Choanephora cucurbitarum]|uniref:Prestalk A differentiation protein A n=1 Tax=Choanephora cucurbitarum TaxID=101091 RepID=A0A1C7NCQ9_9FUNG|nr:Prestalk A differentiation protein A [Choanephora cucurbitarum]